MGVNYNHIVLYGFRLPYEKYDHEKFEDYDLRNSTEGDVVAISDGRGGDYLFVGILQYCSDDGRYDRATIPIMEPTDPTSKQAIELGRVIGELQLDPTGEPTHYVFTHFY